MIAEENSRIKTCLQQQRWRQQPAPGSSDSRSAAKVALKRRKRMEKRVEHLFTQQLNLEQIYEEILASDTNKKIVQSYESGLTAMKAMLDSSLVDKTHSTMSEIADLISINKELEETLILQDESNMGDDLEK